METNNVLNAVSGNYPEYIEGTTCDERLGRYHIAFRVGYYCRFNEINLSNQLHYHDCFEICIVLEGRGLFIHEGARFPIAIGDVFIAEPRARHEIRVKEEENLLLLYFFVDISEIFITRDMSYPDSLISNFLAGHTFHVNQQLHLFAYFNFLKSYRNGHHENTFWINQALRNLILEILEILTPAPRREKHFNNSSDGDAYLKSLDYIFQNLHKRITARDIAGYARTSARNIYYLFHKNLGKTVNDFVNEKKIDLAEHYLNLDFSIAEVAGLVGIGDPSVFCRLFKKYKGIAPKQYQKSIHSGYRNYGIRKN